MKIVTDGIAIYGIGCTTQAAIADARSNFGPRAREIAPAEGYDGTDTLCVLSCDAGLADTVRAKGGAFAFEIHGRGTRAVVVPA